MTGPRESKHGIYVLGKENGDLKLLARERLGRSCQGVTTAPPVLVGKGKTSDTARTGEGSFERAGAPLRRGAAGATSLLAPGGGWICGYATRSPLIFGGVAWVLLTK